MKLGVFTTFTPEYTFSEACQLIKSLGYDGVQPRIVPSGTFDPTKPFNPWSNNKGGILESDFFADPKGTLKPALDAGLEISSVASYAKTDDMERAVAMVQACGKLDIRNVRVGGARAPKDDVYDWRKLVDEDRSRYRELVDEAKKVGVRPCLELHMGTPYPGASGVIGFLNGFTPDEVGVLYDPANMISDGWEQVGLALNILGPFLAEIHVKNSAWLPTGKEENGVKIWRADSAPLEDGCVNWAEVIDKVKKHGYDGWLVEEGHVQGISSYDRLKSAHDLLRQLVAS